MKNILTKITLIIAAMVWLSGCSHIKVQTKDGLIPLSAYLKSNEDVEDEGPSRGTTYWPLFNNQSDIDKWINFIGRNQGKLLPEKNEKTLTNFIAKDDWVGSSIFTERDGGLLKKYIQSDTGVIMPVYEYYFERNGIPNVRPNWAATKRVFDMANRLNAKVLPFSDTERLHDNMIEMSFAGVEFFSSRGVEIMLKGLSRSPKYIFTDPLMPRDFTNRARVLYSRVNGKLQPNGASLSSFFDKEDLLTYPYNALLKPVMAIVPTETIAASNRADVSGTTFTSLNICRVVNVTHLRHIIDIGKTKPRWDDTRELKSLIAQQDQLNLQQTVLCPPLLKEQGVFGTLTSTRLN